MVERFYSFQQSPEQRRRLGARGGRAYGRNQRIRRALQATARVTIQPEAEPQATAAESIAVLDANFPWLRGAEKIRFLKRGPAMAEGRYSLTVPSRNVPKA
jgi:hypothetical protein